MLCTGEEPSTGPGDIGNVQKWNTEFIASFLNLRSNFTKINLNKECKCFLTFELIDTMKERKKSCQIRCPWKRGQLFRTAQITSLFKESSIHAI